MDFQYLLSGFRWEVFEHVVDVAIYHLGVPGIVGPEILCRQTSPEKLLRASLEQIYHQVANIVVSGGRRCNAGTETRTTPAAAPTAAHVVIHGLHLLLIVDIVGREDRHRTAGGYQLPSIGLQLLIDRLLNARHKERVRGLNLPPRICVELREICRVVVVGPHIASKSCHGAPHQNNRHECSLYITLHRTSSSSTVVETNIWWSYLLVKLLRSSPRVSRVAAELPPNHRGQYT